jgi:hypothetical protein
MHVICSGGVGGAVGFEKVLYSSASESIGIPHLGGRPNVDHLMEILIIQHL